MLCDLARLGNEIITNSAIDKSVEFEMDKERKIIGHR